ncbi:hypothetical protein [Fulvivirga sediminis]|nr:hypothetical protein [Fulvivirga sediminis]
MKELLNLYRKYKEYVRVDLLMYAAMILTIIGYFIYELASH